MPKRKKLIDRALAYVGLARTSSQTAVARGYKAARNSRLTADWSTSQTSSNAELRRDLRSLRTRSRNLARDNDIIKKFLRMVTANVVGPGGISLRIQFDSHGNSTNDRDSALAAKIEAAWKEWGRPETASTSGKLSFVDQLHFAMRAMARDGEFLCREVAANNPFGYALNFRDVAWLDENYNAVLPGGHRVLMSVEIDKDDRPTRYWLTRPSSDYLYPEYDTRFSFRTPVSASEIIHKFLVTEDEIQTRGVPWAHTAMESLHTLDGYVEAELYASRAGACVTDYLIPPANDEYNEYFDNDTIKQVGSMVATPQDGARVRDLESGVQQELPPGWKVEPNDPKHPNTNFGDFWKAVMRSVASGLEVSYVSLANDLEGVNYSSIRAGLLEERDLWRGLQRYMIEHFCHRVFQNWLNAAMVTGAVQLSIRDRMRVRDTWRPRGWDWVDPMKDIQAAILAVNNGLESRTDYCDERGDDFFENVKKLEAEEKALKAAGLSRAPSMTKPVIQQPKENDEAETSERESGSPENEEIEAARLLPAFRSQVDSELAS